MPVVPLIAAWLGAVSMVVALLLAPTAASATPLTGSAEHTSAGTVSGPDARTADLSTFQPGNIISDAVFFDSGSMTAAQIQAFLEDKVPSCRSGYTCLKDWYDTSRATTADAMCGAYAGGYRERASQIIYKVAQACGINPQVILATLQKEQGLVNHVWPSDWRYTIAMGQGCPDTAACDERYYGFFNQVYGAAWQFKRYANPSGTSQYFTWYAPGKTWNVLYHPNRDCGSSPVYIQNQATANLYYYTPYQPNAAALRAGYGEGDGCSSYGNRNFFQYFTDWFGSTQSSSSVLIKHGDPVYLVTAGRRYHVTKEDYPEFQKAFGNPVPVSAASVASLSDSGRASRYLRNETTGEVAFLEGGRKHWFNTCTQVLAWGSRCGSEMRVDDSLYAKIRTGAAMTSFARVVDSPHIHLVDGGQLVPLFDRATLASLNGGRSSTYAPTMPHSIAATMDVAPLRFESGEFLTVGESVRVWLPTTDGRLIYLANWAHASEFGLPGDVARPSVPESLVEQHDRTQVLSLFATCGGSQFFAAGGVLHRITDSAASNFSPTTLDDATCAALDYSPQASLANVYIRAEGEAEVYMAVDGEYRHVTSRALLEELSGGSWPTVLTVGRRTLSTLAVGDPLETLWSVVGRPSGSVVQAYGADPVYLVDGATGWWIPTWAVGEEFGIRNRLEKLPANVVAHLAVASEKLRPLVRCGTDSYVAAQGVLHPIDASAIGGLPTTALSEATCETLNRSGAAISGKLFVRVGDTEYIAEGSTFRAVSSEEDRVTLNGGTKPNPVVWHPRTLDFMRAG